VDRFRWKGQCKKLKHTHWNCLLACCRTARLRCQSLARPPHQSSPSRQWSGREPTAAPHHHEQFSISSDIFGLKTTMGGEMHMFEQGKCLPAGVVDDRVTLFRRKYCRRPALESARPVRRPCVGLDFVAVRVCDCSTVNCCTRAWALSVSVGQPFSQELIGLKQTNKEQQRTGL
jgi:hypothetical protein